MIAFETEKVVSSVMDDLFCSIDNKLWQNNLLSHLLEYNCHQFQQVTYTQLMHFSHLLKPQSLHSPYYIAPTEEPMPPPIDDLLVNHIKIEKLLITRQPTEGISEKSVFQSTVKQPDLIQEKAAVKFSQTFLEAPQKRIDLNEETVVKLQQIEEDEMEKIQENLMRNKLYEKRRQLRNIVQKRQPIKRAPIAKGEKITFDFEGQLIKILPQVRSPKQQLKMRSDSMVQSQRYTRLKDDSIHQVTEGRHQSSQGPLPGRTIARFYNNNNSRQTTHIPHISLKSQTKIIENNQRLKQGPRLTKVFKREFQDIVVLQHFKHHTQRLREQQNTKEQSDGLFDTQNPKVISGIQFTSQHSTPRRMRAETMALIPAKKSFNFAVASVPARDTPIQRYYRFDYDAQQKKFRSSQRLVPLSKTNVTHSSQQESFDRIVTHNAKYGIANK